MCAETAGLVVSQGAGRAWDARRHLWQWRPWLFPLLGKSAPPPKSPPNATKSSRVSFRNVPHSNGGEDE